MHATTRLLGGWHATFHTSIASEFHDEACDCCTPLFFICRSLSKPKQQVLCLDKTFAPCSFAWFMAIKFETGIFCNLKTLFLVLLLRLWLQKPKPEVSDLIRPLLLVLVYGFNFQQGKFL